MRDAPSNPAFNTAESAISRLLSDADITPYQRPSDTADMTTAMRYASNGMRHALDVLRMHAAIMHKGTDMYVHGYSLVWSFMRGGFRLVPDFRFFAGKDYATMLDTRGLWFRVTILRTSASVAQDMFAITTNLFASEVYPALADFEKYSEQVDMHLKHKHHAAPTNNPFMS